MTIYRTTMRQALEEMYQNLNEDNLDLMRKAAGGAKQTLKMKDGKIGMDSFTASAIMQIYDKINDKNKKTFENMMKNGKKADIMKLQKFAMSKVNASYEEFEEEVELVLEGGDYKSKEDAMSAAADAYAKQRDPLDEIEVYKMSGNKFEINHPMNSSGRDSIQKRGGKLIAKVGKNYKEEVELDEVSPNKQKSDVIVMKKGNVEKSVVGASGVKKAEKEGYKIQYALLAPNGKKVTSPKDIMKAIKSADKLGIGEEVELDEDGDEFGKFQDYARLYGGGDEIYVVTQGKDSNSQKVIGIEKDPNKAKKIRDGAKGSKARIYGQMKKSQKTFKLKVGDPVSFEDSKNKLSFIEEVELDEDIATMAMVVMGLNAAALLPVLFMSVREIIRGTPLESSIKNVVDKLKKNKNYKMSDSEKSDVKGFVSKVKKDKPSLLQKAVKQAKLNLLKDQSHEEVEEGAAADARRAMRNDPDMKQRAFSKDVSSTDDDEKAASKNIMMQLRKAVSLRSYDVEFADGKKQKVDQRIAQAVQNKYNKMRRPADKEKFQAQIAKSYKDMLKTIKSGYGEQKESILEKIDRKIKENKNG